MSNVSGRVLILTPDSNAPIGGVKVNYQVVDALNAGGCPAAIVHRKRGFRCTWFDNTTAVISQQQLRVDAADVIVVPEEWTGAIPSLPSRPRKVIFNANAYTTFSWGLDATAAAAIYARPDVVRVVVLSEENRRYLEYAFGSTNVEIMAMRCTVDPTHFRMAGPKQRSVAYMPRKRRQETNDVLSLLRARGSLDGWEIRAIDGLTEERTAEILREAGVFLAFSHREGFGLPPAEAMACGCVVIGFHGFAGAEISEEARWIPDGDVVAFAQAVEDELEHWDERVVERQARVERIAASVRDKYSPAASAADALAAFALPPVDGGAGPGEALPAEIWGERTAVQKLQRRMQGAFAYIAHGHGLFP